MGKYTKLPAPRTDYTTTYDVRVPMRDGVELLANLLEPKGKASGTVLVTSPYGINMVGQAMTGGFMARRGYRVLLVKCRGTFGSGGTFVPFAQEADDAADIVAWMRERPWFDGRFATQGYSYLGFVQWALLMDPPPEMKAAVIACCPYDFSAFARGTGAFHLSTLFEWSFVVTHQEDPILRRMTAIRFSRKQIRQAMDRLPLTAADDELLHGAAPWYREWIAGAILGDPLWKNANFPPTPAPPRPSPPPPPTSPLTYVGMVRFYGYADHEHTGELAEVLMQAGADKDDETKNGSPLICAASHGDAAVVRALLDAGADLELFDADAPSDTALRVAAAYGFPEVVDELIAAGATINSVIEAAAAGDLTGWSIAELSDFERACALRAAAVNERLTTIDQLLAAGTPIDAEVDGLPAIHWAYEQGRSKAAEHLASRGATQPR